MIRGVNRFTVEISRTGSPYFERAICFVRPQFSDCSRLSLHRAAAEMLRGFDSSVEPLVAEDGAQPPAGIVPFFERLPAWSRITIPALCGAIIMLLFVLLIQH